MSAMTDIIFLLLIFFMLTSNFVRIQPFQLPKSDSKTVAATSVVVSISKAGEYTLNSEPVAAEELETRLEAEVNKVKAEEGDPDAKGNYPNISVTIVAEVGTPFEQVNAIVKLAARYRVRAIIATEPRS
jgi:biopolymer transport protein ExbD